MHENEWTRNIAEGMRQCYPQEFIVEQSYTPYGSDDIHSKAGYSDILSVNEEGEISIVEVKRHNSPALKKWQVIGELLFYTFLIETQLCHDNDQYLWLRKLITKGAFSQKAVDAIERRHANREGLVRDWAIVICGGDRASLEMNEALWHMHDYVNSRPMRPLTFLHGTMEDQSFRIETITNTFRRDAPGCA